MKKFYSTAFINKPTKKYVISKKKNEVYYKYNDYKLGEQKALNIDELFDKDEQELNKKVIGTIKHFYTIDADKGIDMLFYSNNKELLNNNNYNFVLNIIELIYTKKILISKNFDDVKKILIRLERNIHEITKNVFDNNNFWEKYMKNNTIKNIKQIFYKIITELTSELKNIKDIGIDADKINYYPVGSLTEFLFILDKKNKIEDDFNIFLDIRKLSISKKKDALHGISKYLKKKYNCKKKIDSNNCIFEFNYQNININFIVLGYGPYIHSILFREYSLMDPRFPILAITLKYFLKKIGIKDKKCLNTFSLMSLLVAFLQDIINPPILPKIFSDQKSEIINKSIPVVSEINEKKINSFIDNMSKKSISLPKNIFYKDKLKQIYKEQILDNKVKNNLTCSEIFLYFLEFLIYYFKFDTLYVNFSLNKEGFDSMNNLINDKYEDEDDINFIDNINYPNDIYFKEFFKQNYNTRIKDKIDLNKKGVYLIRDPMNPFYNPADSLKKKEFDIFFEKIRKGHEILLNTGSFDALKKLNP
jgi:hypothetical protein